MSNHLSAGYRNHLAADYGEARACQLDEVRLKAPLPERPEDSVEYLRLNQGAEPAWRPILFINGFTAGIVANAPFAGAMAARGFDFIIAEQRRTGLMKTPAGKRDATYTQAHNLAAVIRAEHLEETPLNVVTHSYGSLVLEALSGMASEQGWSCFEGAKAVMLAPAGVKEDESALRFLRRYTQLLRAGSRLEKFADSYWEHADEMLAAGMQYFRENTALSLREGYEIMSRHVDMHQLLARGIGEVALVPFAEDALYPSTELDESIAALLLNPQITAFSPISLQLDEKGLRSGRGADHSDQQFNPERVAGSVAQYLHS